MVEQVRQFNYASSHGVRPIAPSHRMLHCIIVLIGGFLNTAVIAFGSTRGHFGYFTFPDFMSGCELAAPFLFTAMFVGILVRRSSLVFKIGLSIFCVIPSALFPLLCSSHASDASDEQWRLSFRCWFADPIPPSVQKVTMESPDDGSSLWLRFRIAKSDLDRIIQAQGLTRIVADRSKAPRPTPTNFNIPQLGDDDEFYQVIFHDPRTEIKTIRVNASHTEAILRYQQN